MLPRVACGVGLGTGFGIGFRRCISGLHFGFHLAYPNDFLDSVELGSHSLKVNCG
jgi:hypothetical protein